MSQFYCWLLSICCDAKIHNGLFNEDKRNECSGCGKIIDMDKGCYSTSDKDNDGCCFGINEHNPWWMTEELQRVIDIADSRFSIGDICDLWYVVYGENMKEEYPGFVDELEQRIA